MECWQYLLLERGVLLFSGHQDEIRALGPRHRITRNGSPPLASGTMIDTPSNVSGRTRGRFLSVATIGITSKQPKDNAALVIVYI